MPEFSSREACLRCWACLCNLGGWRAEHHHARRFFAGVDSDSRAYRVRSSRHWAGASAFHLSEDSGEQTVDCFAKDDALAC
jgi:hypothetical protein